MFVVVVKFFVAKGEIDNFLPLMRKQAEDSLNNEEACRYFDVCVKDEDPSAETSLVYLYELYDNKQAFDLHLDTQHFKQFSAAVKDWVVEKEVETYTRL